MMINKKKNRIEKDSLGEIEVPIDAYWGAQTQRAIYNFKISELRLHQRMIKALSIIKFCYAKSNAEAGLMEHHIANAIGTAARQLMDGFISTEQFPLDIFQTGSGTSFNMNTNEVITHITHQKTTYNIHPNNHVNMSQSSNDVFPSAIHISAVLGVKESLIPALSKLSNIIGEKAKKYAHVAKNGRTHLMDAMPVTLLQEMDGWKAQINQNIERIEDSLKHLQKLALGGTAVGTGINTKPEISQKACEYIGNLTGIQFTPMDNLFVGLACQDAILSLSGQLNTLATALIKISNDLRWMNSGPLMGLGEIQLQSLQPGSSIMPGKVNPVIPEAVMMMGAQVMGNHTTISTSNTHGNFQLNVMLPIISHSINESIDILGNGAIALGDLAIQTFEVQEKNIAENLSKNPILITALNRTIGYELGSKIAKESYEQNTPLLQVALKHTDLSEEELKVLLDPINLTKGGIFETK